MTRLLITPNSSAVITDPNQQAYAPGSFTVATGKYIIMSNHWIGTGTQHFIGQGTARIRVT